MAKAEIAEYRGCENLVYAKITKDDSESYTTGEVKELAGLAEVGVTVEQSSETKYYDNNPALVLKGQGAETRTFTIDHLPLSLLAELTGQSVDEETGAILGGGDVENPYFAVGYITEVTSGIKTYKWALKGTFAIPDETNTTKNGGTDSNNLSLVYTGIATTHKFAKDGKKRTYVALEDIQPDGSTIDLSKWFDKVQTPDTLSSFTKVPAQ